MVSEDLEGTEGGFGYLGFSQGNIKVVQLVMKRLFTHFYKVLARAKIDILLNPSISRSFIQNH